MAKEQRTLGFHLDCPLTARLFHRNQTLRAGPISFTSFCRMNRFSFYKCEGGGLFLSSISKGTAVEKKLITYSGVHTCVQTPRAGSPVGFSYKGWGADSLQVFTAQALLRARQKSRHCWTMQGAHLLHRTATSSAEAERQCWPVQAAAVVFGGGGWHHLRCLDHLSIHHPA